MISYDKNKKIIQKAISHLKVFPSQANFLLINCDNAQSLHNSLVENGILVKGFSSDSDLSDFIRISVSVPNENNTLIAAIKDYYG